MATVPPKTVPAIIRPLHVNKEENELLVGSSDNVRGFKPDIDTAPWLLTQVVHDLTNQGYTNRIQLEVKLEELPE
ncbi:MAG: hypothetical protein ACRDAJ_13830 [Serratia fonticola]